MNYDTAPTTHPDDDGTLTPEIRALLGVCALYHHVQTAFEEVAPLSGLSDQAQYMLIRLEHPQRMGDLARITNSLPSTVTALADLLQDKGLLERTRDVRDRRVWMLSLTAEGTALRTEMVSSASELFRQFTGLNAEETRIFAALSDRVRSNIHDRILQGHSV